MTSSPLFDPIRQKWVANTPEEKLRQRVISWLLGPGGFLPHEILVEKSLNSRLGFNKDSDRRFDIACVRLISTHEIQWLLLIECKAKIDTLEVLESSQRQVEGYAFFLTQPAQAIALASPEGCWYCKNDSPRKWVIGLPAKKSLFLS